MSPSVELQEAEPQPVAPALLDHLIDERKHVCRKNVETDRTGGLEIEDERAGRARCLIVRRAPAEATRLDSEIRRLGDWNAIIDKSAMR
jgi:hypothetical protein